VNNFESETIKASMLFKNSGTLSLAMDYRAPKIDGSWTKMRLFPS
jgi:hypothetical protein